MKYTLMIVLTLCAVSASAADWPQFHGPNRDNKSTDEGLLQAWPEGGPSRLWEASGIGEGYATVAIAGRRIYTAGAIDDDCVITALDLQGRPVWTQKNGKAWQRSYPGTRSTPTIVDGLLYHFSSIGNLICLKADTGEKVWSVNILEKFDGRNIIWGLAESPLVIGDKVICTPGGKDVSMVALNRHTGDVVWQCTGVGDKPGYASPILVDYQGLQQIVTAMSESIIGVRASDGKLLWRFAHKVYTEQNILTPLFHDGFLIISGCVRKGTRSLKLQVSGHECSVEQRWHNETLDNKHGGIVLVDGKLYGYAESQNNTAPWMCIDFVSGDTIFQAAPVQSSYKYKNGCLTYADGRFYLYSDDGDVALARATPNGYEVTGRLTLKEPGERPTWAFPVVHGGRLYLRYGDKLGVYDVSAGADEAPSRQAGKLPGLAIDFQQRCVDIDGTLCLDQGMLELIACTQNTKEHESIVAIRAKPMHIHMALLLLGVKPGHPAMRQPVNEEKTQWIDIPPQGDPVDVFLVFTDEGGRTVEHPISEFVARVAPQSGQIPAEDADGDTAFPATFLFAGSQVRGDGPGPRKYLSDLSGNVISISTFGDELLCLPGVHTQANESLVWQVNGAKLPRVGAKVVLRLRAHVTPRTPDPVHTPQ